MTSKPEEETLIFPIFFCKFNVFYFSLSLPEGYQSLSPLLIFKILWRPKFDEKTKFIEWDKEGQCPKECQEYTVKV